MSENNTSFINKLLNITNHYFRYTLPSLSIYYFIIPTKQKSNNSDIPKQVTFTQPHDNHILMYL